MSTAARALLPSRRRGGGHELSSDRASGDPESTRTGPGEHQHLCLSAQPSVLNTARDSSPRIVTADDQLLSV